MVCLVCDGTSRIVGWEAGSNRTEKTGGLNTAPYSIVCAVKHSKKDTNDPFLPSSIMAPSLVSKGTLKDRGVMLRLKYNHTPPLFSTKLSLRQHFLKAELLSSPPLCCLLLPRLVVVKDEKHPSPSRNAAALLEGGFCLCSRASRKRASEIRYLKHQQTTLLLSPCVLPHLLL